MKLGCPPCTSFHRIVNDVTTANGRSYAGLALGGCLSRADDDRVCRPPERVTVREHMAHVVLEKGPVRHPYPVPERVPRRRHEDVGGLDDARVVTEGKAQDPAVHVEGETQGFAGRRDRVRANDGRERPPAPVENSRVQTLVRTPDGQDRKSVV